MNTKYLNTGNDDFGMVLNCAVRYEIEAGIRNIDMVLFLSDHLREFSNRMVRVLSWDLDREGFFRSAFQKDPDMAVFWGTLRDSAEQVSLERGWGQGELQPACPTPLEMSEFVSCILRDAAFYGFGRRTFVTELIPDFISPLIPGMMPGHLMEMTREIDRRKKKNLLGDPCDEESWMSFKALCEAELDATLPYLDD